MILKSGWMLEWIEKIYELIENNMFLPSYLLVFTSL